MEITEIIDGYEFGRMTPNDTLFAELQTVIHDRFVIEGYISPIPERRIVDEHISASTYFYAKEHVSGKIVGGFRMISPEFKNLPIQKEFELYPEIRNEITLLSAEEYVEVSRLAVLPGYNIAECLYRQGWQYSKTMGHKAWVISADKRLWTLFKRFRGLVFRQAGDSKQYLGSATVPGIATLDELAHSMKERAPRFYYYMTGATPDYLYTSL